MLTASAQKLLLKPSLSSMHVALSNKVMLIILDSHINISLGIPYFFPTANNFAINDSDNEKKNDKCNIKSSSSSKIVSL